MRFAGRRFNRTVNAENEGCPSLVGLATRPCPLGRKVEPEESKKSEPTSVRASIAYGAYGGGGASPVESEVRDRRLEAS